MIENIVIRKKGISAIIATVLLVLLVIVAVSLIWGLIMPVLQEKIMEFSESCFNANLKINTKEGYTCFDGVTNEMGIMITRGPESFTLYSVQIILSAGGISQQFEVTEDLPDLNEDKTYRINMTGTDLDGKIIESVAIAPIVKIGNSKRICGITSRVKTSSCA